MSQAEHSHNADKPAKAQVKIDLALQGGGSHGAFTWGVIDALLADGRLAVEGICGTSAGAMNATVLAYGIHLNGNQGGRDKLAEFWERTAAASAKTSPFRPSWFDRMVSPGNMDFSPSWIAFDNLSRMLSPYQLNPLNFNPLKELLLEVVDFEALRTCTATNLFLAATNVLTGKIKVFKTHEMRVEAVLASACLPFIFQAVEVDGQYYWDGGYMGNPPIYPLIYGTETEDILIIQINPINLPELPKSAQGIYDRVNTLSFNSSLMREMRIIAFVTKLIDEGKLPRGRYKRLNIHMIHAEDVMQKLGVSSKLNADRGFLQYLFDIGQERAKTFLQDHFDKIGKESSTDIGEVFL
ncbi:MAG: patatin-like phospholipase family protein [Geminicoccaceae bacterium]